MESRSEKKELVAEFEEALPKVEAQGYILRLLVSGATPKSIEAIENIKKICEEYVPNQHELEVIDIYQQPQLATAERVVAAPTLVKKFPPPLRKLIGSLSDTEQALKKLGLEKSKE